MRLLSLLVNRPNLQTLPTVLSNVTYYILFDVQITGKRIKPYYLFNSDCILYLFLQSKDPLQNQSAVQKYPLQVSSDHCVCLLFLYIELTIFFSD